MTLERDGTVQLPDGRTLGYAEYGDPDGLPVVVCHGMPGSRLDFALPGIDEALRTRALRVLAVDRPGIGLSSPQPKRKLLDWPTDVERLVDALDVGRFVVLGLSGGGAYALACARSHPDRLLAAGVVAPPVPPGMSELVRELDPQARRRHRWAPWLPALLKGQARAAHAALSPPAPAPDRVVAPLSEPDRAALADPELADHWLTAWREGFRQGTDGPWWDLVLISRRWGFAPAEIALPIRLWFGGEDRLAPPVVGRRLANALPRSMARLYPREGHFSLLPHRIGEILDGIESAAGRPSPA